MILDLVAEGRKVGVTANSHKVIGKVLDDVIDAARKDARFAGHLPRLGQKPAEGEVPTCAEAQPLPSATAVRDALAAARGSMSWAARPGSGRERQARRVRATSSFVDEAGQFSLANAVAVSAAAESLVLLGDPQQLEQPHPGHSPAGCRAQRARPTCSRSTPPCPATAASSSTDTWRLHPDICAFTSEVFYEGRWSRSRATRSKGLSASPPLDGTGVRFAGRRPRGRPAMTPIRPTEAEAVAEIVARLLVIRGARGQTTRANRAPMRPEDILIVAPYNAQAPHPSCLDARGEAAGRSASARWTSSRARRRRSSSTRWRRRAPEDAPRGMEFLYTLNRLNVATSRARCLTLVVASPALVLVDAKTPRQMELANALCRFVEVARDVDQEVLPPDTFVTARLEGGV